MLMSLFHRIGFFKCFSFSFLFPSGKVLLLNSLIAHMLIFYMYALKV